MKTSWLTIVLLVFTTGRIQGQVSQSDPPAIAGQGTVPVQDTPYAVVERGANQRVWQRTTYETTPDGGQVPHLHKYTELATGMHYRENGQWVDSKEEIDILPNGTAAATQGQHQAYFPGDINQGVIELVTPDGVHLKSRLLGLSYDDGAHTVLIAELKDSVGLVVGPNQVIYPDAFTDFKADLRYTYTKAGFEQDIILREQPPGPDTYGLDPQTARLQLLTEFFDAPEPVITKPIATSQSNSSDTQLAFGTMTMIRGKAFLIGSEAQSSTYPQNVPVTKSWQILSGRTFLVEELPVQRIETQLQQLPVPASTAAAVNPQCSVRHKVSATRLLPPVHMVQTSTNAIQLAKAGPQRKQGVVLDYVSLNTDTNDFTFQADTTYRISSSVNLSGNTTIEGGTVIKFDTSCFYCINVLGTNHCRTAPDRTAVFTTADDKTLGEDVGDNSVPDIQCTGTLTMHVQNNWSEDLNDVFVFIFVIDDWFFKVCDEAFEDPVLKSGDSKDYYFTAGLGGYYHFQAYDVWGNSFSYYFSPTSNYVAFEVGSDGSVSYSETGDALCEPATMNKIALALENGGSVHDVRFKNVTRGIYSTAACSVTNAQFVNCSNAMAIENASFYAGNILISQVGTAFYGRNYQGQVEQLTFDQGTLLTDDEEGTNRTSAITLVNALLTGIAGDGVVPVTTNQVAKLANSSGIYQVVGGASYYLVTNSPYRNTGTTNINPALLAELRQGTMTRSSPCR